METETRKRLRTTKEAAEFLRISVRSLYGLLAENRLRRIRITRRRVLIDQADLDRYVDAQGAGAQANK